LLERFYIRRTQEQKRFTISEVTANWRELMITQRTMRPSIARVREQWTGGLQQADTTAPINHTRPSFRSP